MKTTWLIPLLLMCWLTPASAEEWLPAKTLAVGGAGRAIPLDNAGISLNPGAITSPYPSYCVETGFQRFDPTRSNVLHFSARDSQSSMLAMGISQTFEWSRPPFDPELDLAWYNDDETDEIEHSRQTARFATALAYGFFMRRFNVGASLRIYRIADDLEGDVTKISADVGLSWWISENVALGVTGGNLIPTHLEEEPTTLAAGFGTVLGGGLLWMELDGVIDFTSSDKTLIDVNAGAQLTLLQQLNIRGGYASGNMFEQQYASWGLGWTTTNFSASYSMRIEIDDMERRLNPDKPPAANRLLHAWLISGNF